MDLSAVKMYRPTSICSEKFFYYIQHHCYCCFLYVLTNSKAAQDTVQVLRVKQKKAFAYTVITERY